MAPLLRCCCPECLKVPWLLGGDHCLTPDNNPDSADGCGAGDAKFGPFTDKRPAHVLQAAMRLMRMISCCSPRCPEFMQRSGMLLRSLHLLRHILAACPTTPPVCITATPVWLLLRCWLLLYDMSKSQALLTYVLHP